MKTTDTPTTRPLAERITPGKTEYLLSNDHEISANVLSDGELIAEACPIGHRDEMNANAELIAEAFAVTHETGKTPRQLADERAELLTALETIIRPFEKGWSVSDMGTRIAEARELLTRLKSRH